MKTIIDPNTQEFWNDLFYDWMLQILETQGVSLTPREL